jgi:hypothetical protein
MLSRVEREARRTAMIAFNKHSIQERVRFVQRARLMTVVLSWQVAQVRSRIEEGQEMAPAFTR